VRLRSRNGVSARGADDSEVDASEELGAEHRAGWVMPMSTREPMKVKLS
jgi:hypothetical protein